MIKHLTELNIADDRLRQSLSSLEDSIVSFSEITQVPVTFYSVAGDIVWQHNNRIKICETNTTYPDPTSHCRHTLKSAMNIALGLGEVYIFVCDSGLTNLAYAFADDNRAIGCFIAGPIAMGTNREKALRHFYNKVDSEMINLPQLLSLTSRIKLFSPNEITNLMTLYGCLFNIPGSGGLNRINRQKAQEQQNVVAKIIKMKKSNIEIDYPVQSENELLAGIFSGDVESCSKHLSKYVEDLMVFENGDLSIIKIRLLSIFAQLSKNSYSFSEYEDLGALESLNNASTFKELMQSVSGYLLSVVEKIAADTYSGSSDVISKAVVYINSNYMNDLSLNKISSHIHVNASYLSTLFKKEMNTTVTAYIQNVRLENAIKKLDNTNSSITEISFACGFDTPSYFTKLFKQKYGKTPRQHRAHGLLHP